MDFLDCDDTNPAHKMMEELLNSVFHKLLSLAWSQWRKLHLPVGNKVSMLLLISKTRRVIKVDITDFKLVPIYMFAGLPIPFNSGKSKSSIFLWNLMQPWLSK